MRLLVLILMTLVHCACGETDFSSEGRERHGGQGGAEDAPTIHLPFAMGVSHKCTQGAHGEYSHSDRSTRFDVDFDTSNAHDEELYAPVAGIARVHESDGGFGRHLNIDRGDGTYVVLAHLKKILVRDGQAVGPGQLVALEGCTGNCTGDHVHLGVHEGDAAEPAERGASIPFHVWIDRGRRSTEELACDVSHGANYRSLQLTTCAHPDGTLLKSAHDPKVYRLDEGELRWIVNEEVFHGYNYHFEDVVTVSERELQSYTHGADIDLDGMVTAGYDDEYHLWLFVGALNRADRYRIRVHDRNWLEVLNSWGVFYTAQEDPPALGDGHELLEEWPAREGYATFRDGTLLHDPARDHVLVVSGGIVLAIENEATLHRLGYDPSRIIEIREGTIYSHFNVYGSCYGNQQGCLTQQALEHCGAVDIRDLQNLGGVSSSEDDELQDGNPCPDGFHPIGYSDDGLVVCDAD